VSSLPQMPSTGEGCNMHRLSAVIATAVPLFAIALLLGPEYRIADLHPMWLFGPCTGGH
jgi:hypothetical protein